MRLADTIDLVVKLHAVVCKGAPAAGLAPYLTAAGVAAWAVLA
jgi:hypothetical protein